MTLAPWAERAIRAREREFDEKLFALIGKKSDPNYSPHLEADTAEMKWELFGDDDAWTEALREDRHTIALAEHDELVVPIRSIGQCKLCQHPDRFRIEEQVEKFNGWVRFLTLPEGISNVGVRRHYQRLHTPWLALVGIDRANKATDLLLGFSD